MAEPHRMRLRPPWEQQRRENELLWRRRFGRPTNLEQHEQVFLVLEAVEVDAEVAVNGTRLGTVRPAGPTARFAITELLEPRNELVLTVVAPSGRQQCTDKLPPLAEVRLEIT